MTSKSIIAVSGFILVAMTAGSPHAQEVDPEPTPGSSEYSSTDPVPEGGQKPRLVSIDSRKYPPSAARKNIEGRCDITWSITVSGLPDNIVADCSDKLFLDEAERVISTARFENMGAEPVPGSVSMRWSLGLPAIDDVPGIQINTPLREQLFQKYKYIPSIKEFADYSSAGRKASRWIYNDLADQLEKVTAKLRVSREDTDLVRVSSRLITTGDPNTWKLIVDGCNGQKATYSSTEDFSIANGNKREARAKRALARILRKKSTRDSLLEFILKQPYCSKMELESLFH